MPFATKQCNFPISKREFYYIRDLPFAKNPELLCKQGGDLAREFSLERESFSARANVIPASPSFFKMLARLNNVSMVYGLYTNYNLRRVIRTALFPLFGFTSPVTAWQTLKPGNCVINAKSLDNLSIFRTAAHEVGHEIAIEKYGDEGEKFAREFEIEFRDWFFSDRGRIENIMLRSKQDY